MPFSSLSAILRRIAPSSLARVHFALDTAVLAASGCVALLLGSLASSSAIVVACLAPSLIWWMAVYALHHYHRGKSHGIVADLVLTGALLSVTCAVWFTLWFLWPNTSAVAVSAYFVRLAVPAVLSLRLGFWSLRIVVASPPINTIIVGTGPLGQQTRRQLSEKRSIRLIGSLAFPGQDVSGDEMGSVDTLPALVRSHAIGKVFIAVGPDVAPPVVREVAETCAAFGVSFALPARSHRCPGGRPKSRQPPLRRHLCSLSPLQQETCSGPRQAAP